MLKTGKGSVVVSVLALICIAAALVFSFVSVVSTQFGAVQQAAVLLRIAALIYAALYILTGHSKTNAASYKIFGYVFALAQIAGLAAASSRGAAYTSLLLSALILALILILTVSKDLGKSNSLTLCGVLFLLTVLHSVMMIGSFGVSALGGQLVKLLLALLYDLMTVAKYQDKAARGSK